MVTLEELVREEGPLSVRDAIGWVARAALAVDSLHIAGIPHGRITAAAILVDKADCHAHGTLKPPSESSDNVIYHSLDRIDGEGASAADDVWALGVTLYFALTGSYPYPEGIEGNIRDNRLKPPTAVAFHRAELDVMQRVIDRTTIPGHPLRATSIDALIAELAELSPNAIDLPALEVNVDIAAEGEKQAQAALQAEQSVVRAAWLSQLKTYAPWAALVMLVSALVTWRLTRNGEQTSPGPATAKPAAVTAKPAPTPLPQPKVPPKSSASAPASASPSATQAGDEPPESVPLNADLVACTAKLFPADAFRKGRVRADFPCREVDMRKALRLITRELVRGGGGRETKATREWVRLGWYRVALLAVARANCCSNPPPLTTPKAFASCGLDEALADLTEASKGTGDSGVLKALDAFYRAARCGHNSGGQQLLGIEQGPGAQQQAMFLSILTRLREPE